MTINELTISLELGLIYGIITVGVYFSSRILSFTDLTCDGSFVLGAAIAGILIKSGANPYLSLGMAMLAGALAGLVTGVLHVRFKLTDILAGILVAFMLYSINLKVMHGVPNIVLLDEITIFSQQKILLVLLGITSFVWLVLGYFLSTDFGLAIRSLGQNKRLAQNVGVNLKRNIVIGLMLSNALIALGGGLFCQHQGFADVGSGVGTIIVASASLMIGEKIFRARSVWLAILSCFIGSILYRIIISLALHADILGLQTQDLNLVTGILIIAVMMLPRGNYASFAKH